MTDVADALVMRRLFRILFASGLVMVSTSNRPPNELYKNGIQRESFVPFIGDVQLRCHVHDLESQSDYRMLAQASLGAGTYMHPLDESTKASADALFTTLIGASRTAPQTLRLATGRDLEVPVAGVSKRVARFDFEALCGRPLGAEDYLALAAEFHTIFVENVPQLTLNEINKVRRLITMVDAFYDNNVKLIVSAAVPAESLFMPEGQASGLAKTSRDVPDSRDEVFAFDRTLSRLQEMRTHAYLLRRGHSHAERSVPSILFESSTSLTVAQVPPRPRRRLAAASPPPRRRLAAASPPHRHRLAAASPPPHRCLAASRSYESLSILAAHEATLTPTTADARRCFDGLTSGQIDRMVAGCAPSPQISAARPPARPPTRPPRSAPSPPASACSLFPPRTLPPVAPPPPSTAAAREGWQVRPPRARARGERFRPALAGRPRHLLFRRQRLERGMQRAAHRRGPRARAVRACLRLVRLHAASDAHPEEHTLRL